MPPPNEGRCKIAPPLRILYADDNHDITDSAVDLLEIVGFEVKGYYDGVSALTAAAEFRPGVCMLDLNMSGMDGDELAVRLRALLSTVVLVAVTAMSDEKSRCRIEEAGFDLHFVKPVDQHKLLSMVDLAWHAFGSSTKSAAGS